MSDDHAPDYVAIGHFAIDRTPEREELGGSVLYAALTVSRLGARAAIITRGNLDDLDSRLNAQFIDIAEEIELIVQSSDASTTFTNEQVADRRIQTLHAWGGEMDLNGLPPHWRSANVIHLAPVAQDFDPKQVGLLAPDYLGVTPQGWMRSWSRTQLGRITSMPLRLPPELISRTHAMVISSEEYSDARDVYERVGQRALAVVTRGRNPATALDRGQLIEGPVFPETRVDTTGAGDVFAAALFWLRSQGYSTIVSLRFASAMASLSVAGYGLSAIPEREAVERLIENRRV